MATRTNPLVTAATLASAAAIAVASPAIAPSLNLPTPHALSAAKVQLATFADVLSVPAVEWTDLLFGNTTWGNVLSSTNYGAPAAKPQDVLGQAGYVNPWADFCAGACNRSGITGAAYLFFDALVNGNGKGYSNSNQWATSIVNYFWEPNATIQVGSGNGSYLNFVSAGFSAATWYALQTTVAKVVPASLLPALSVALATPFWGPHLVTIGYTAALTSVAALLSVVPGVGKFTGNSILAYLGTLAIPNTSPVQYYQKGLSGALNYWTDIVTGAVKFPAAATSAAASTASAAAAPAVAPAAAVTAPETPAVSNALKSAAPAAAESTPAPKAPESTPPASVSDNTPAAKAPESTPAATTPAAETPAVSAPESTPAVTETKPAGVPDVSVPDAPAADVTGGRPGPAKAAPKHPVRDAVEKVTKQITSAINGAKAAKADSAS